MPLPEFNANGDLPPGVHRASWTEVRGASVGDLVSEKFARGAWPIFLFFFTNSRGVRPVCQRFVIFGSYVTAKANPNDVDVILIMDDAFRLDNCPMESRALFDHAVAQARYGASVFWIRPALLIGETVEQFIVYWQIKRGGGQRGILDVIL